MPQQRLAQHQGRFDECATLVMLVGQSDRRRQVVRPALERRVVAGNRGIAVACALECDHCVDPAGLGCRHGNAFRRRHHHRPVTALDPGALEVRERHDQALLGSGPQVQVAPLVIETDQRGIVPLGEEVAHVLQDDHRISGCDFTQHIRIPRGEQIADTAQAAGRCQHLHLQAALTRGKVKLVAQLFGRDRHAAVRQNGRHGGGAALIFGLRKEGNAGHFDPPGHAFRPVRAKRHGLRDELCATSQQDCQGPAEQARAQSGPHRRRGGRVARLQITCGRQSTKSRRQ